MTWCFSDQAAPETDRLLEELPSLQAIVPALWHFEVANVLATAIRKNRISVAQATTFLTRLEALPITLEKRLSPVTGNDLFPLVLRYGLTAYDAAYLELARRQGYAIATLDRELIAAARQESIPLMLP